MSRAATAAPAILFVIVLTSVVTVVNPVRERPPRTAPSRRPKASMRIVERQEHPDLRVSLVHVVEAGSRVVALPQEHAAVGTDAEVPIYRNDEPGERRVDVVVRVRAVRGLAFAEDRAVPHVD